MPDAIITLLFRSSASNWAGFGVGCETCTDDNAVVGARLFSWTASLLGAIIGLLQRQAKNRALRLDLTTNLDGMAGVVYRCYATRKGTHHEASWDAYKGKDTYRYWIASGAYWLWSIF